MNERCYLYRCVWHLHWLQSSCHFLSYISYTVLRYFLGFQASLDRHRITTTFRTIDHKTTVTGSTSVESRCSCSTCGQRFSSTISHKAIPVPNFNCLLHIHIQKMSFRIISFSLSFQDRWNIVKRRVIFNLVHNAPQRWQCCELFVYDLLT